MTLNPAQLEAVHHLAGPCLVLAGAGSGKTRVIVHKIARLLETGHAPAQIAAITFTNKAAAEMRERARALVGGKAAGKLAISTFHSLGVRMLREHGERVGLKPNFSILDSDDVLGILKDAGGTTDNALARRWQWAISAWKNRGLTSDGAEADALSGDGDGLDKGRSREDALVAARVMKRYEERLAAYQAADQSSGDCSPANVNGFSMATVNIGLLKQIDLAASCSIIPSLTKRSCCRKRNDRGEHRD